MNVEKMKAEIEREIAEGVVLHGHEGARDKVLSLFQLDATDEATCAAFDAAWSVIEPRIQFTDHARGSGKASARRIALADAS